jgi:SET domain-containing protein
MPSSKPSCWPNVLNIQYLNSSRYHSSITSQIRSQILGVQKATPDHQNHRSLVHIRAISDATHPAVGQYGLFAARKIPPKTHIIDYVGELHCDDRDSDYDLSLYRSQDGVNVGIDASTMGNEARFINDYRGVRDKPNAAFADGRTASGELRMSVWSGGQAIKKGDEILVSYGKGWWRARQENGTH